MKKIFNVLQQPLGKLTTTVVASFVLLQSAPAQAALLVTPTGDVNVLIPTILGSGITASNLTYTGSPSASGTFTGGLSTGIGIDKGIILTSGGAALASSNGYTVNAPSQSNGTPGDSDLSALAGGIATQDASTLSFDFTSNSSNIFFNFVFASAEYPNYVNQFNDTFGFFVDGKNIALIPGTTTPVTINNINAGKNQALFNDNTSSKFQLPYGGFTNVFTASALGLSPGTHNIKIGVADALDSNLDSAVFIQANTFSSTTPTTAVPEPFTIIGSIVGGTAAFRMRKKLKAIAK